MTINYDLSVIDILHLLGYTTPAAKAKIEAFEKENNLKVPEPLFTFLSLATEQPLFSTADVWTARRPFFFYDEIKEWIEEDQAYWQENPTVYSDNPYYQFWQIPQSQWPERVANYLEIGSDCGAGVVTFGICSSDLERHDPPVYLYHEANPLTEWNLMFNTLSAYLMSVTCSVLFCAEYGTAERVLQQQGWIFQHYNNSEEAQKQLSEQGVVLSKTNQVISIYSLEAKLSCCYDTANHTLFIILEEPNNLKLCTITK